MLLMLSVLPIVGHTGADGVPVAGEWPNYRNDPGGMRFSPLKQINRKNVSKLKIAWVYHTGDISDGHDGPRSGFETTPLFFADTLFITTPFNRVIVLDPATGRERWAFDPKIDRTWPSGDGLINRGLATWLDGKPGASLGGPIVTAGGLAVIAGTFLDPHIRAFDVDTGRELWSAELPTSGQATPMSYLFSGKQYVVIAAGGRSKLAEEPLSDAVEAFALP